MKKRMARPYEDWVAPTPDPSWATALIEVGCGAILYIILGLIVTSAFIFLTH